MRERDQIDRKVTESRDDKNLFSFSSEKTKKFSFSVLKCLHPPLVPLHSHTHTHFSLSRDIKMKFIHFLFPTSSNLPSYTFPWSSLTIQRQRDFDFVTIHRVVYKRLLRRCWVWNFYVINFYGIVGRTSLNIFIVS